MRSFAITSALLSIATIASAQNSTVAPATGKLGNAIVSTGNPSGVTYVATFPEEAFAYPGPQGNVKGSISATAGPNGEGVTFSVNFSNLPKSGGPLMYHLHVAPVPANGNCTATLAHLDPTERGEVPLCDASKPETCQTGDLSGKFGNATSDPFVQTFTDPYSSLTPGVGAFFGNRSIVFHFANKTRITCANFVRVNGTSPTNGTAPTSAPTASATFVPANAAAGNMVSGLYVLGLAGLTALFL